jgi:hypothetical protein
LVKRIFDKYNDIVMKSMKILYFAQDFPKSYHEAVVSGMVKIPFYHACLIARKGNEEIKGPKLSRKEYVEAIRNFKISLALDGQGEFTFRHLELWYMGAFMICS